ncbi:TIGR02099 family protein [Thiorhodococcus mannitoliphagus]|uniref:TIGR02099 family protein n=1 Tax=Thiorhodococcus mannitoliphagus TaxID=329406 RepID=A0A6P1DXF4_9GAMM|nr:YhdP family protein [Thiorhodococcus mannitoliphagus]NEX21406.1 TIGR02099 family protein [Thiorhodococcus mannitoliphagus]
MLLLKRLSAHSFRLGFVVLVLAALLVSLLTLVQPLANEYRDEVAQLLSERLGYQVAIGSMRLSTSGFAPRLTLERVRLSKPDDGEVALSLKAMELDLNLPATLRSRTPQFNAFTLVGARLVVEHLEDGRWRILGLGRLRSDDPRALELFLHQGRLNLVESEILYVDHPLAGKVMRLVELQLSLENSERSHALSLSGRLVPPDPVLSASAEPSVAAEAAMLDGDRIQVLASLDGPPTDPWSWSGRVYAKLKVADAGLLTSGHRLGLGPLKTQRLALESWLQLKDGQLGRGLVSVDLSGLSAGLPPGLLGDEATGSGSEPLSLGRLRAWARVRQQAPGWQLQLAVIDAELQGAALSDLNIDARLTADGRLAGLGATAAELDLADLARAAASLPWALADPVRELIARGPRGVARDLALGIAPGRDAKQTASWRWRLATELVDLGLDQAGDIPGFEGLHATVTADEGGGEIRLASGQMNLDLNPIFTLPIPLNRLGGQLAWRHDEDAGWHLEARDIDLATRDLSGRAQFSMDLPDDGASPFLDLRASFQDADASQTRRYLPVGILVPELVTWLEQAIRGGRVTQGDAIFRGRLADYPFRANQGRFELLLQFEDLLLDYQDGWPAIESAEGSLRLFNQGLSIRVDHGRIYDSDLFDGRAHIPELWDVESMRIHGVAQGPFEDGRRVLSESPLAADLGSLAKVLEVTGESRLAMDIDLPFLPGRQMGVEGRLDWPGPATLAIADTPLELTDLSGEVSFNERGLSAESVGAKLFGRSLKLGIGTQGSGDPETSLTRIEARAQSSVKSLAQRFPSDLWRLVDGQFDWLLRVDFHNRDVSKPNLPLDFRLSSELRGVALNLPEPLGKTAKAARELDVEGALIPDRSLTLAGHLGDLAGNLSFDLTAPRNRFAGGRLRLGEGPAAQPESPDLLLEGVLTRLDLDAWLGWLEANEVDQGAAAVGVPLHLDLKADELGFGRMRLEDVRLELDPDRDGWQVGVHAAALAGSISVPPKGDARPLGLNFQHLDLDALRKAAQASDEAAPASMSKLPALDLRVTELRWGDVLLGALDLSLRNQPSRLSIPKIHLSGPGLLSVRGEGGWDQGAEPGGSRLDLVIETQELGRLLTELSGQRVLEAADASAQVALAWPGGLTDFALPRAEGAIDLKVGAGRFLEVEPGVGRLLGFLNFSALGRRLSLDFSDLYGQGFAFEQVAGKVAIGQGRASFEDFVIDGSAGKVMVAGSTDLRLERFDQTVTVEPNLGSSVALASAVAGGPVVGAAVYLVDQVAGNPINRLARYEYKISGPWGAPELTRMGWEPLVTRGAPALPKGAGQGEEATASKRKTNHFLDVE